MGMYFPVHDILNDTILGIPNDTADNWETVIDALSNNIKSED